jgi:hypothetical protein
MSIGYNASPGKAVMKKLCSEGGLFRWPDSVMQWLSTKNSKKPAKVLEDQLEIVDYLLEHCAELCLEPAKDISTNPGWEKYLLKY